MYSRQKDMLCLGGSGVLGGRGPVAISQKPAEGSSVAFLQVGLDPEGDVEDTERF